MAQQYYQIVSQEQVIQTVSLEELQRYYPNLCVESNTGIHYVLNNQDENNGQFQSQQVLLSNDQQVVINSGEAGQVLIDQNHISYQQPVQSQYCVQEEITEYQQNDINNTQQLFYSPPIQKQQIIQPSPPTQMINQIDQRQLVGQQIIQNQHVNPQQITQMIPQQQPTPQQHEVQVNNSHNLMGQRRIQIPPNQHEIVNQSPHNIQRPVQVNTVNVPRQILQQTPTNIQRPITQNVSNISGPTQTNPEHIVPRHIPPTSVQRQIQQNFVNATTKSPNRLQYVHQQQNQPTPHQQPVPMETDEKRILLSDGRYVPLTQFKNDMNQTAEENIVNHSETLNIAKTQLPQPKRGRRSVNVNNRGGGRGRNRGAQNNQMQMNQQNVQIMQDDVDNSKQFQQINNVHPPKVITYTGQNVNQFKRTTVAQQRTMPITTQQNVIQTIHQQQTQPPQSPSPQQQQQVIQTTNIHSQMQQQHTVPVATSSHRPMQLSTIQPPQPQQVHNIQQQTVMQPVVQQQQQQQQQQFQQAAANRVQPPIPLNPFIQNGHVKNNTGSSPNMDDSSNLSDEYKNSSCMLVCLENEQRLITFTLPKESCTVQDLLEQVGVVFNPETKIECISNPGEEIEIIVYVGAARNTTYPLIDSQKVLTVDNMSESQECIVSQTGAIIPISEAQAQQQLAEEIPKPKTPELPPEPPKEVPKFIPGCLAVCNHCGYLSEDFNRCQRCKTKLPEDVKSMSTNRPDEKDKQKKAPTQSKTPATTVSTSATSNTTTTNTLTPKVPLKPNINTPRSAPGARSTRGRKPKTAEMEAVVLSSDDEESIPKTVITPMGLTKLLDSSITISVIKKEPNIANEKDLEIDTELDEYIGGCRSESLLRKSLTFTNLSCRTVRIGSYKFVPKDEVIISPVGVKICVPVLGNTNGTSNILVPMKGIVRVLCSFSKTLPVIFLYVLPSVATSVRKYLNMDDGHENYFDPLSKEEPQKRITLLPEVIMDASKNKIKEIFSTTREYNILEELSPKEANDILIRTCPKEISTPKRTIPNVTCDVRQLLIIYPPGKGGLGISNEDYACLAQDQFLNDVIIDFYLKYLMTDIINPDIKDKVYIFSSFFYRRLTSKSTNAQRRGAGNDADANLTPAEKRHSRVKNWTKNVNIFEKDFIIIPINENSHWFLAIICFPGMEGCRSMNDTNKIIKEPAKEKKKINASITIGNTTITTVKCEKKILEKSIKCDDDEDDQALSDRDEAEGDESELEESDEGEPEIEDKKNKEPIKQPCILIFDSLAGAGRSRVVATLRDYLTCEYKIKIKTTKQFTKDNIKGACPKVPQQMNFTDCGLYLLQYVESFFKDPITDYRIPIKQLKNWFEEIVVTRKREDISKLIRKLMIENKKDPSILPDITFPTLNGELIVNSDANFTDEEEEEEEEEDEIFKKHTPIEGEEKGEGALDQLQTYNSDSESETPSIASQRSSSSSTLLTSSTPTTPTTSDAISTTPFVVKTVPIPVKLSTSAENKKISNRDTMSYLKSKRISRHKNLDTTEPKKVRIE